MKSLRRFFFRIAFFAFFISIHPAGAAEPGTLPFWNFTASEEWSAEWLDKQTPSPFTLTFGDKGGLTVSFTESTAEVTCPLRALRWRTIDPLAVQPVRFSVQITAAAGTGIALAPRVLDANGNVFQLTPKPATTGTLTWDLSTDLTGKINKKTVDAVPAGTVLTGPVFLDQIQVIKAAGPAASVEFDKGEVVDPQRGTMALGKDPVFHFTEDEYWNDVNVFDESAMKIEVQPDGLAVTYGPSKKKAVFKLGMPGRKASEAGALGRSARIYTDVELVEGAAGSAILSLGLKDSENEVVSADGIPLNPGHNELVWDSTKVRSPWRGGHNGVVDFPLVLDDYTLVMQATETQTKVVLHSATKEVLHKLVYQSGLEAGRPMYLWNPGETAEVHIQLTNLGDQPYSRPFQIALKDDMEHEIWTRSETATLPAHGKGEIVAKVETKDLLHGVYLLSWASSETSDAIQGRALLTVADTAPIPKAKDGDFFYGMDIGSHYNEENILDWTDWCGVDVIRNGGRFAYIKGQDMLSDTQNSLDALTKRGLRASVLFDAGTPWDPDPVKFDKIVADRAAIAGSVATQFKGKFVWYEIGNEPSLQPFFFHGPPADYVKFYLALHDAIKAGDPTAVVTNGGWAFGGAAGAEQRVREMAKLIPADKIDGWAYHGHGVGAPVERYYFEKAKSAANYPDKINKPYYETESGQTSTDPATWRQQARTAVQKLSFAQSTHVIPCFIWFGLFPEWEWGILENWKQAKPAALAFRVLVQRTRGLRAQDRLDLAGAKGEGYWFTAPSGDTTVVLWSDEGTYTRNVVLGAGCTNVVSYDLFGNPKPVNPAADGAVQMQVGLDPVYLCAKRPAGTALVTVQPPPLDLPALLRVVPASTADFAFKVHNRSDTAFQGTVEIIPSGQTPIEKNQADVSVPAAGQSPLSVTLNVKDVPVPWWPRAWTVFAPVNGSVDLTSFNAIPDTLTSDGKPVLPQTGLVRGTELELGPLGGGYRERRQAICFAHVHLEADQDIEFGAGADFWMEWVINGKQVLSTLDTGNGGSEVGVLNHTAKVHLKKGDNLFAVKVLSGSLGWRLLSGGPEALASARQAAGGAADDMLQVNLRQGDHVIDSETVHLAVLPPLEAQSGADWATLAPDATTGTVDNLFKGAPDQSHWYHGATDLSGRFWFRTRADGALIIEAAIKDDIDKPGDALHIDLATGKNLDKRLQFSSGQPQVTRRRDEATTLTWYEVVIPRADLGTQARQAIAIKLTVDDDDWGALKQTSTSSFSNDPASWYQTWFPKE